MINRARPHEHPLPPSPFKGPNPLPSPAERSRSAHCLPRDARAAPGRTAPTRRSMCTRTYGRFPSGTATSPERCGIGKFQQALVYRTPWHVDSAPREGDHRAGGRRLPPAGAAARGRPDLARGPTRRQGMEHGPAPDSRRSRRSAHHRSFAGLQGEASSRRAGLEDISVFDLCMQKAAPLAVCFLFNTHPVVPCVRRTEHRIVAQEEWHVCRWPQPQYEELTRQRGRPV